MGPPIVLLALAVPPLATATFARARFLRRRRGRMSARIADAVRAGESIQAAGGIRRELNALDRDSGKVVDAAVARARITGLVRASTVTAASLSTAAVVVLGALGMIDAAGVASAMTLLGVMAAPMGELGRVIEYRQNYRAARRIQAPLLAQAEAPRRAEEDREERWRTSPGTVGAPAVGAEDPPLVVQGRRVPMLQAGEGDSIRIRSHDPGRMQPVLVDLLAGPELRHRAGGEDTPGWRWWWTATTTPWPRAARRRTLLGHASARVPLERGTAARAITYRHPRATGSRPGRPSRRVGPRRGPGRPAPGAGTRLKNGGDPLTGLPGGAAQARPGAHGQPAVLVLEGLDAELDEEGPGPVARRTRGLPRGWCCSPRSPRSGSPPATGSGPSTRPEGLHLDWRTWNTSFRP